MKSATLHELRKELIQLTPEQLSELCTRLARFKRENKELLTYLLFEAHNEAGFVRSAKEEIDTLYAEINGANPLYLQKKSLRKILRMTLKFIRYSGDPVTEIELLLHFCLRLRESGIAWQESVVLSNLYKAQVKKIGKVFGGLHEDLQSDYHEEVRRIGINDPDR